MPVGDSEINERRKSAYECSLARPPDSSRGWMRSFYGTDVSGDSHSHNREWRKGGNGSDLKTDKVEYKQA